MSEPFRCEPSDETWTMTDSDYRPVMIVQRGADVFIDLGTGSHTRRFDGAKRDIFSRCLFEAERRAEAHAEAVARATVPGQVDG